MDNLNFLVSSCFNIRGYLEAVLVGSACSTASAGSFNAKRPFGGPQRVLRYLANYTHRVALSNRRIVTVDALHQTVTFTYRDYRHGSQLKELTLSARSSSSGASACTSCLRD